MWLWHEQGDHIRFDVGHRVDRIKFVEYKSDEQFAPEARRLAVTAAGEVARLRVLLPDLDAAISWLTEHSAGRQGWPGYNLGVALGLAGRRAEAIECLRALAARVDEPAWWRAAVARAHELARLIERDTDTFHAEVQHAISSFRASLRLDPEVASAVPR